MLGDQNNCFNSFSKSFHSMLSRHKRIVAKVIFHEIRQDKVAIRRWSATYISAKRQTWRRLGETSGQPTVDELIITRVRCWWSRSDDWSETGRTGTIRIGKRRARIKRIWTCTRYHETLTIESKQWLTRWRSGCCHLSVCRQKTSYPCHVLLRRLLYGLNLYSLLVMPDSRTKCSCHKKT